MDLLLDPVETRVLGCLIEKEITTPEYYPMTMNALVNACNQKSNRDPAVSWDEQTVAEAVDSLRTKKLIVTLTGGGNRVPKYSHRVQEVLNLGRREIAVLCELMVRGPQTLGELRERASRMHRIADNEEVERVIAHLNEHPGGPLAMQIPRQPGQKETRYVQLLSGEPDISALAAAGPVSRGTVDASPELRQRVEELELEVARLKARLTHVMDELGISPDPAG
jgi:uncharacterized protein YceH (UPF0502 family)